MFAFLVFNCVFGQKVFPSFCGVSSFPILLSNLPPQIGFVNSQFQFVILVTYLLSAKHKKVLNLFGSGNIMHSVKNIC